MGAAGNAASRPDGNEGLTNRALASLEGPCTLVAAEKAFDFVESHD